MNIIKDIQGLLSKALRRGTSSSDSLIPEILEKYTDSLLKLGKNNKFFVRRSNIDFPYLIQDPKQHHRNPLNRVNYHEFYLDHNPYWDGFPKRYNSIMFLSVDLDIRKNSSYFGYIKDQVPMIYGNKIYLVIPPNDAKISVSPKSDMIISFKSADLYTFNRYINALFYIFVPNEDSRDFAFITSNEEFISFCDEVNKGLISLRGKNTEELDYDTLHALKSFSNGLSAHNYGIDWHDLIENIILAGGFLQFLYKRFNPNDANFFITNMNDISKIENNKECWTDSECLLINLDSIDIDELNKLLGFNRNEE